jgi:hypothetical protein
LQVTGSTAMTERNEARLARTKSPTATRARQGQQAAATLSAEKSVR